MDLVVRQARVWGRDGLWDVGVAGGRYAEIARAVPGAGGREIEARGGLLAPAFVDPHIHLDKVLVAEDVRPNQSGTLHEAIEILWERKAAYTVEEIVRRAGRVIESAAPRASGPTWTWTPSASCARWRAWPRRASATGT
jgi:cytosine deaminase